MSWGCCLVSESGIVLREAAIVCSSQITMDFSVWALKDWLLQSAPSLLAAEGRAVVLIVMHNDFRSVEQKTKKGWMDCLI